MTWCHARGGRGLQLSSLSLKASGCGVTCYKLKVTIKVITFFFLALTHMNLTMNEMRQFLENRELPKLARDELAALKGLNSRLKTSRETKSPGPGGFTGEFHQTFQEASAPILHDLFQETEDETTPPPNSSHEASLTLTPKDNEEMI